MKTSDVHISKQYTAKVTNKLVVVEIIAENPHGGWDAKNLATGKTVRIKSAQGLRGFAKQAVTSRPVATEDPAPIQSPDKPKIPDTPPPVANTLRVKQVSALDAAARVLAEASEPMNCRQLIDTMTEKNYWQPKKAGKTPQNTLHAAICKEIKVKGTDSRFEKVGRGQFALANG
ncbi:MAG: winged helix-turn-helix domain-containing protein [Phycisphaerae bacterium]|nr:winged helix-turn-helix domain-containing protein [Phycisphaerae bacterium]